MPTPKPALPESSPRSASPKKPPALTERQKVRITVAGMFLAPLLRSSFPPDDKAMMGHMAEALDRAEALIALDEARETEANRRTAFGVSADQ